MQTREQKIEKLAKLVNKFARYIDDYKKTTYNEANLREEFLNPFFELLDWDVRNEENNHLNYKDVIVEERIDVYGSDTKKAPDYTFRIGGAKKFFVEAKKPSVDIKDAFEPAFQVRRYGHSAGLYLSILTDFEEFSVYDTRKKPNKNDSPTKNRIAYYKYTDYVEKFDEIYNLFSKTAIKQGSFEQFEKDDKHRKGNESIDEGILDLVDAFREILAKNIAKNNEDIDVPTLNKAVIKIIDRLFFLRIAEDKEVEPYKTLLNVTDRSEIYDNLKKIFKEADRRYNSELFKYFKDIDGLIIDDKILKEIIINLYTPECVYEFSQIPVSILGSMYEQFLGKTIRITDGGHVKIEEKPEVKKAGGVYYTPEYIVNYIVKNTVGEKIKGLTPKEIEKIKILDPACGSGSFLIGAYQYLIDYHIDYYTQEKQIKKALKNKLIAKTKDGYILSIPEKQRILLNNIFGVDIDQQAVEVAKFSLLLKLMESEDKNTSQGELFKEGHVVIQMLPNLSNNIKCGNSLIGTDYYNTVDMELFEKDDYNKINAFDWEKEFPEICKSGGFDCVIGNPPYVFTKYVDWGEDTKEYLTTKYLLEKNDRVVKTKANQAGKINLFAIFILKSMEVLNKKGLFSFIIPNNILRTTVYDIVRKKILENTSLKYIVDLKSDVFKGATVSTLIMVFENQYRTKNTVKVIDNPKDKKNIIESQTSMKQDGFLNNVSYALNIFSNNQDETLFKKLKLKSIELSKIVCVYNGIATFKDKAGICDKIQNNNCKKIIFGKDIKRYCVSWTNKYIEYIPSKLLRARDENIFLAKEKLIMQRIGGILITAYDNNQYYTFNSVNNLLLINKNYNIKYILAILNSQLLKFYYVKNFTNNSSLTVNISKTFLDMLPIPIIDLTNQKQKEQHDKMVELVDQMLEIQKQLHSAKTESDKQFYQKKADIIDNQIDTLVYELYGLTAEEIKIVES